MYAISRIEAKPGIWCWAIAFRERGRTRYKSFYDTKCSGSRKAHTAAKAWRDSQLARRLTYTYREFHQLRRANNTSGAPGVIFLTQKRTPKGLWQAKLKLPDGRQMTKSFSVGKYGHKEAFELAVGARAEMVLAIQDRPFLHHPTAKKFAAKR